MDGIDGISLDKIFAWLEKGGAFGSVLLGVMLYFERKEKREILSKSQKVLEDLHVALTILSERVGRKNGDSSSSSQ